MPSTSLSPNTKLDPTTKEILHKVASAVRQLSIDAVEKANSGHPGLPLGCAELGAYLYGVALQHNPKDPHWLNRDRFVLSAGHGSMWLYSLLHLSGYKVTLDDIKQFRQLHSRTPGHPESLDTEGVETTTGPLGQGVANAVGMALGMKLLGAKFNTDNYRLFDNKIYALMGDGCVMEGISSEASSLAGHLQLDNLILIYDSNKVSLDGPLSDSCSEDTKRRYEAYGWDVYEVDGHDLDAIHEVMTSACHAQKRPCLIIAHTIIGKGSPHKAGTNKVHGSPLGPEEAKLTKEALGLSEEPFFVPQAVYDFFEVKRHKQAELEEKWNHLLHGWEQSHPELAREFKVMHNKTLPVDLEKMLKKIEISSPIAGRIASHTVIQHLARLLPFIYGGSADLSCSDMTMIKEFGVVTPGNFSGRNIKFGVREFAMASMGNGLSQTEMIIPFVGTFLTFSDYMRNAIRLASLMKAHVIYQFTHDSVMLGEDGPTHQPVEQIASLRAMPNLHVIRPADTNEVKMAWLAALRYEGPTALILSRQGIRQLAETDRSFEDGVGRGAYILHGEKGKKVDFCLVATGSEVALAMDVAAELEKRDKVVRVISMPCWELFELQSKDYRESLFGGNLGKRVSIEAASDFGWYKYIGSDGIAICVDHFGLSAPQDQIAHEFGFTVEAILERIL